MVFAKIWLNNVYYINYSPIYLFLKLWPLLLGGSSSPSASSSISMTFKASLRRLSELLHLYLCCRYCPSNVDEALKVGLFEQWQDYYDQCRHRNIVSLVGYKKKEIHVDNISKHITTSCNVGFHISIHNISKRYWRDVYFITF